MEKTIFRAFLIKYAEIAIKGKNRYMFEDALVESMRKALTEVEGEFEVTKEMGRIYVYLIKNALNIVFSINLYPLLMSCITTKHWK